MQASGNDFVMVDNRSQRIEPDKASELAQAVCDRRFGVGSDGLILLEENESGELVMNFKNPDGSDAGMCGNGGRCFVLFARRLGYSSEITFRVHGKTYQGRMIGDLSAGSGEGSAVATDAGSDFGSDVATDAGSDAGNLSADTPRDHTEAFPQKARISLSFPLETVAKPLEIDGEECLQIYTNTEHLVCWGGDSELNAGDSKTARTDDSELNAGDIDHLREKGRRLRYHKKFEPAGTNVNFVRGTGPDTLQAQTYERGVENLTLACGTGAIASALGWHFYQDESEGQFRYRVMTPGGELQVRFTCRNDRRYHQIELEGPAETVFEGTYYH